MLLLKTVFNIKNNFNIWTDLIIIQEAYKSDCFTLHSKIHIVCYDVINAFCYFCTRKLSPLLYSFSQMFKHQLCVRDIKPGWG